MHAQRDEQRGARLPRRVQRDKPHVGLTTSRREAPVEQACNVALEALRLGEQLRSARCVNYLREFHGRLKRIGAFEEQAGESRLWRIASRAAQ